MTTGQAASASRVTKETICRWIKRGVEMGRNRRLTLPARRVPIKGGGQRYDVLPGDLNDFKRAKKGEKARA